MSRIGKAPITIDPSISIELKENHIIIKGPKGELEHSVPSKITVQIKDQEIKIKTTDSSKEARELHGLSRTIINNMIIGVSNGFVKMLELQGVGYRAQTDQDKKLILHVGYSHPVKITPPPGIKIKVENSNKILVEGINKSMVGQIASQIRLIRPPEPYKGKGIRYQNEIIKKKVGKAGK